MNRINISLWLEENTGILNGLTWFNREECTVKVTWEKKGTPDYKDTFEICLCYSQRIKRQSQLSEADRKSRFYDALKKSPNVFIIERCTNLQHGNYLLCQLLSCSNTTSCDMEVDEGVANCSSPNGFPVVNRIPFEAPMYYSIRGLRNHSVIPGYCISECDFAEALAGGAVDIYKITLYIEGKQIFEDEIDFSTGLRFHFENHLKARCDPTTFSNPEVEELFKYHPITFPYDYNNMNEKLEKNFSTAARGIALKSTGGCLTGVRLCQMRIHYNEPHMPRFTKMKRWERKCLFSLDDYERSSTSNPYPCDEVFLLFGRLPKPGMHSPILIRLKSSLVKREYSSSVSVSLEDSFDQLEQLLASCEPDLYS